jgi:hypothetical protein
MVVVVVVVTHGRLLIIELKKEFYIPGTQDFRSRAPSILIVVVVVVAVVLLYRL